ncbi:hypothetical protein MOQ06_21035 [Enterobacter sp. I4]|uniref:DUF7683 domain-containing protein n=1 Tax=Enterobacter TaxID=547 RepID=UPI001F5ABFC8|nr:hypothetical protein [Enterobacter sp. I4]MCI2293848.1 hypothetical protein [Enterobacter sp. I4]
MIIYSVEVFDKQSEELILEVEIPQSKLKGVAAIMGWGPDDEDAFVKGIAGFNVSQKQALELENLLGEKFYSEDAIVQIAGGETS